jgi:hypothetical protein
VLGLAVHFAWAWHQPLSLCDIDRNAEKYSGRIIRLRAFVSHDVYIGGSVSLDPTTTAASACHGTDNWSEARVSLDAQQASLLKENRNVWRQEQEHDKVYISDVILVGMFDPHDDGITHCWAPKYELVNAKIERVVSTQELTRAQVFGWIESKAH